MAPMVGAIPAHRLVYGYRHPGARHWESAHQQGMKGLDEAHHTMDVQLMTAVFGGAQPLAPMVGAILARHPRSGLRVQISWSKASWEFAHQQGMQGQGLDGAHHVMSVQLLWPIKGPNNGRGYVFTDLRIYPLPSPSRRPTHVR